MTAVLIPWSGNDPDRMAALGWVQGRWPWAAFLGVIDGPWCKARAVDAALRQTDSEILVIADADVWCDEIPEAVAAVKNGAPWAVPHGKVHRLTRNATRSVLAGATPTADTPCDQRPYRGHPGGGIVVIRRDVYTSCPLDPRFTGWGQEDDSWALALGALHGPTWRGTAPLWHLWHEPQARKNRRIGSDRGQALHARYKACRHNPAAMRSLIEEARCATAPV